MQKNVYRCNGRYHSFGKTTEDPVGDKWLYAEIYGSSGVFIDRININYENMPAHGHFCDFDCATEFFKDRLFPADPVPAAKEESNG